MQKFRLVGCFNLSKEQCVLCVEVFPRYHDTIKNWSYKCVSGDVPPIGAGCQGIYLLDIGLFRGHYCVKLVSDSSGKALSTTSVFGRDKERR